MNALKTNKFKVGDEVEIVSLQGTDGIGYRGDCNVWIGETGVVTGVVTGVGVGEMPYIVEINDRAWNWSGNNLKLVNEETQTYNPLIAQEGGGHYKGRGIQPLEYTMKNNLSFCEGNVVKYISRYKSKNGVEDLAKVIHYALLASYEEYGEQGSTELKEKVLKLLGEHG
jgi:hypothetical protein